MSKQSEGLHCSRQCNLTESAIIQKVDLTTGHLVKLETRHLCCTYLFSNITATHCDWLPGELGHYKSPLQSQLRTPSTGITSSSHSITLFSVRLSQKVRNEKLYWAFKFKRNLAAWLLLMWFWNVPRSENLQEWSLPSSACVWLVQPLQHLWVSKHW